MKNKNLIISLLFVLLCFSDIQAKTRKAIYIIVDGIPTDCILRLRPKTIFDIAAKGHFGQAYAGGEVGAYSQTPTVSAIGYTNILTGTWMNKHNVNGNENLKPNYNYWSLFRIAKSQKKDYSTALFSSWTDNRTVLIGEKKPETNNLKIDYIYDGYELDKTKFPKKKDQLQIFDIDSIVANAAATCIREKAPDISWTYLWYTDDAFHMYGNGQFSDKYILKTDRLIAKIWDAVQYREKNFDEEWMIIVTTDHGREESGHGHGGQSVRERSVWMSTNIKGVNTEFGSPQLSHVDILPTICRFMNFDIPQNVAFEQDGIPFIGKFDIYDLKTKPYDDQVTLSWKCNDSAQTATVYMATTNHYKEGGSDGWKVIGKVAAKQGSYKIDLSKYEKSKFYKFVVATPNNHIGRWLLKSNN
jgi:hypothetical protein